MSPASNGGISPPLAELPKPERGKVHSWSYMHRDGTVTTWESEDGEPWKIVVWKDNANVR